MPMTSHDPTAPGPERVGTTITSSYPVLMTRDVAAAHAYFTEVLRYATTFAVDWYVSLVRDGHELALLHPDHSTIPEGFRGSTASGVLVNLEVGDVDAFHADLPDDPRVRVVLPLRTEAFGQRHFILAGPEDVLIDVITPIAPGEEYAAAFAPGTSAS